MSPDSYLALAKALSTPDLLAALLIFASWALVGWFIEHPPAGFPSVSILMKRYRREWMTHYIRRDPRIFDGNVLASLREGTSFFASACMIAIGGTLALISNTERLHDIASEFDLAESSLVAWELKLLVPIYFLVTSFLKFVWAHRLFGYCAIMMAAVPDDPQNPVAHERASQAAELNITAARSFNAGLRSVYFALGGLAWLAGSGALIVATLLVIYVTLRREFASQSRRIIMRSLPPVSLPDPARLRSPKPHDMPQ